MALGLSKSRTEMNAEPFEGTLMPAPANSSGADQSGGNEDIKAKVGWVAYVWERPETPAELAKNPPSQADQFFDRLDVNGDDVITPDEIPARMRPLMLVAGVAWASEVSGADGFA